MLHQRERLIINMTSAQIRRLILLLSLLCFSQITIASWPAWLGKSVEKDTEQAWQVTPEYGAVSFSPRKEDPEIWVLLSKKAASYDTALTVLLKDFAQSMPNASFKVYLLPKKETQLLEWINRAEQSADLIFTLGSQATQDLYQTYAGGKIPVVSVNAKDPVLLGLIDNYESSNNNFAFTSLNLPAETILIFLRYFMPDLKQIGILYGAQNTSAYLSQYQPLAEKAKLENLVTVPFGIGKRKEEELKTVMKQQIALMRQHDPGLKHSLLWMTGSSSLFDQMDEINVLSDSLPILSAVPEIVKATPDSALMSIGVSFENNARLAAYYAMQILNGQKKAKELRVGVLSPPDISINMNKVKNKNKRIPFMLIEMANKIYVDT